MTEPWKERALVAEAIVARLDVGIRLGLSRDQALRLQGESEQELEADAKELWGAGVEGPETLSSDLQRKVARPPADAEPEEEEAEGVPPPGPVLRSGFQPGVTALNGDALTQSVMRKLGIPRSRL